MASPPHAAARSLMPISPWPPASAGPGPWPSSVTVTLLPAFYTVVPTFFYIGLVVLVALQAAAGRIGWWSPALVVLGVGVVVASKDLLPLSALLNLAGLAPLARRPGHGGPPASTPVIARNTNR
ncbi:hypothetical protein [Nonomuraea turcica]|uniref:hypothetical protein n=1 Tax=Nonomuraea sp. G32 TaxID=3067274 RepID=UPI00273C0BBE|nr:hypothetical protein [Nonomuraea sp. G32]MDP4502394.1 hypothetical protein [Nonomuraea sp. G32]